MHDLINTDGLGKQASASWSFVKLCLKIFIQNFCCFSGKHCPDVLQKHPGFYTEHIFSNSKFSIDDSLLWQIHLLNSVKV